MADQPVTPVTETPATPPAAIGGPATQTPHIDMNQLSREMVAAAAAAVVDQLKPFQETLAKLSGWAPVPGQLGTTVTLSDVEKLLDRRDLVRQTAATQAEARSRFATEKMADLPEIYRQQLGDDPAAWPQQEQSIRTRYQADFKAAGGTIADIGGSNPGGQKPAAAIDLTKLSAYDLIGLGLKTSKPSPAVSASSPVPPGRG